MGWEDPGHDVMADIFAACSIDRQRLHWSKPMATRTGAPYTSFEAFVCNREHGGCGILYYLDQQDQEDLVCGNCGHTPLSSVTVTTNDQYSEG